MRAVVRHAFVHLINCKNTFMSQNLKDFTSVSPSAKSLLMMKGYTDIPFAKQTAALVSGSEVFDLSFDENDFWFWIRVMHFESRYKSIDQLLQQTDGTHILELSSGYSMRGLAMCANDEKIHYIDTDLPEVVALKREMIDTLKADVKGKFELQPLNVMDEAAFREVVARFGPGPLTIVNEGLLMYLNTEEKIWLCQQIRQVLKQLGGCWITADIYVKRTAEMMVQLPQSQSETAFLEQHHIEENKFDSYDAAKAFFEEQGFALIKEAEPNHAQLSVLPHLLRVMPEEIRTSKEPPPRIQATWMLQAV
jgi:O-methyltransferase involved in polyketide biosynthesis